MKKLTKEQAGWLIEKIKTRKWTGYGDSGQVEDDICDVINQCTEKKFPKFEIKTNTDGFIEVTQLSGPLMIDVCVNFNGVNGAVAVSQLDFNQFKAFTQGCISICQWLDEQE